MEVDWRDSVVKPFNEQLADKYPFNPDALQDASLDAFERFFKPDGMLDTFYQQNLRLFMENDLSLEDGDNSVIIREDIREQLETAQNPRHLLQQTKRSGHTVCGGNRITLSGNKRAACWNSDGQLGGLQPGA